jgi:hypothetical protein
MAPMEAPSRGKMTSSKHNGCHREFYADVRLLKSNLVVSHGRTWPWANPILETPPLSNSSILSEAIWGTAFDGAVY